MKNPKIYLLFFLTMLAIKTNAQVSFTISPSLCAGNTTTVVAHTGTLTALAYSWAASPTGPVFSASSSATTAITFPSPGTFTIGVGILTGSGYSYTINTIVINPSPTLVISASSPTVCAGQSVTLTATGSTSYTWSPAISLNTTSGASVIATPSVSTAYNVTGILGSCTASVSQPILVNPIPSPGSLTINSTAPGGICAGFTATLTAFGANSYTWTGTNIVTPISQQSLSAGVGSYTVMGLSGGCMLTNSITVALNPNINITVTQSSPTTCITSNFPQFSKLVHLSASGASGYVWLPYNPNQPSASTLDVRPAATTCYTVVGSTPTCSGTAVSCVTVIPQFSITVSPASASICLSQSVTLGVSGVGALAVGPSSVFTYNWAEALNAPPISISNYFTPTVSVYPQNSTTYTVEVGDAANCISLPALVAVSVMTCTGIDKLTYNDLSFSVYPNPSKDKIFIKSAIHSVVSVEIINIIGETVLKEKRNFNPDNLTQSFTISDFPSGVYFVRINPEFGAQNIIRIIKQ